ncbi:MAG: outer membrane protein assembly factor BamA [Acidobacteriota bacterium]|nr:outer membrane protein assembly factor BamA [Blastocatellia bacterium]MDW8237987.1 outer membrane protein assembly factor BamA [Acidobacteriota bacterium]
MKTLTARGIALAARISHRHPGRVDSRKRRLVFFWFPIPVSRLLTASSRLLTPSSRLLTSLFWLLAAGCWLLAAAAQSSDFTPYLDRPVSQVLVLYGEAPITKDEAYLADLIGIRSGDRLHLPTVRESIIRLIKSGNAANVVVNAEQTPTGLLLTFNITPVPLLERVSFDGVAEERLDELRRRLPPLEPGTRITPTLLNRAADDIVQYHNSLGYFTASVAYDLKVQSGGRRALVTFKVTAGPRATVKTIEFDGPLKLDRQRVLSAFRLQAGAPYSETMLQEDIERLRRLHIEQGYLAPRISTPRIRPDRERGDVTITIPIDSGPLVDVQIQGFSIPKSDTRIIFPMFESGGIDPATLEEGRLKLIDYLQRRGYFFAEVTLAPVQSTDDRVVISYEVDTGGIYNLKQIRIEGAESLSYETLKQNLGSRPGGLFSRGLTSRELIETDQRVIVEHLRARGYLNARVRETRLSIALNREDLIIIYVVAAGQQSVITNIAFNGNTAISSAELMAQLSLNAGDPLSQPRLNEDATRLAALYSSRGYAEARVDVQVEFPQSENAQARVTFNISEGPQLTIHRILFRGNTRTTERGLRRFLAFQENQWLVNERLITTEQDLYATGAFRRIVINKEPAPSPDQRDVVIELVEAPRYVMSYGGGFRTDDGPRGLFEITNTNLLGRLYTGSFRARVSRREQLGQLSFTNPRPFGYRWATLASAFYQREERDPFDANRLTGLLQVERQFSNERLLIVRYSFSNVIISEVTDPERLRRQDTTAKIGRLSGSLLWDQRDSALDPTRGHYTTLDFSIAADQLGGDENFVRFFTEHQRYYQLPLGSTVMATNVRIGLADPFGRSTTIPISERFFAGGSTTLRGFSFENAGPRELNPRRPGQTQPIGGNALTIINAELRFPLWRRVGLGAALFYDGGNVFAKVSDIEWRKMSHTVGFGLRLKTPVGPVRFDVGLLVKREPLVPRTRFHFNFGPPF